MFTAGRRRKGREHFRRCDELSDVTLGVLRSVEQEAEYCRRQLSASNATDVEKRRLTRRSKLFQGPFDRLVERGHELAVNVLGEVRMLFSGELGLLR
jgi:hypothetical protein